MTTTNFIISADDAIKLLDVFYNSPYKNVLPYVTILHDLKESNEGILSLKEFVDLKVKAEAAIPMEA